jgi:hypothetical protein
MTDNNNAFLPVISVSLSCLRLPCILHDCCSENLLMYSTRALEHERLPLKEAQYFSFHLFLSLHDNFYARFPPVAPKTSHFRESAKSIWIVLHKFLISQNKTKQIVFILSHYTKTNSNHLPFPSLPIMENITMNTSNINIFSAMENEAAAGQSSPLIGSVSGRPRRCKVPSDISGIMMNPSPPSSPVCFTLGNDVILNNLPAIPSYCHKLFPTEREVSMISPTRRLHRLKRRLLLESVLHDTADQIDALNHQLSSSSSS